MNCIYVYMMSLNQKYNGAIARNGSKNVPVSWMLLCGVISVRKLLVWDMVWRESHSHDQKPQIPDVCICLTSGDDIVRKSLHFVLLTVLRAWYDTWDPFC